MKAAQFLVLCGLALPLVPAQQAASFNDPIRVRLPQFFVALTPARYNITLIQAQYVRDAVESIFDEYLSNLAWDASTFYEYVGLAGVDDVFVDDTITPATLMIKIRGGLVVFGGQTTNVPPVHHLETMLQASLYPESPNELTLTSLISTLDDFHFVESSTYESIGSPVPSQTPNVSGLITDAPSVLTPTPTLSVVLTEPPSVPYPRPTISVELTEPPSMPSPTPTLSVELTEHPSLTPDSFLLPSLSPTLLVTIAEQTTFTPSVASETLYPTSTPTQKPSLLLAIATEKPSPHPSQATLTPSLVQTVSTFVPNTSGPLIPSNSPISVYPVPLQPSQIPTIVIEQSVAPYYAPSLSPQAVPSDTLTGQSSRTPTFDKENSAIVGENAVSGSISSPQDQRMIGGVIAGVIAFSAIASVLFLLNRRGKRQKQWKAGAAHEFPHDDLDGEGLHKKDHLQEQNAVDGRSDAGSSIIGRLLAAARAAPSQSLLNESPVTTPRSLSGSDPESAFDDFGIEISLVEPSPINSEAGLYRHLEHVNPNIPAAWQNMTVVGPFQCVLTPTNISSVLHFDRWSDCSTNQENAMNLVELDTDGQFTDGNFTDNDVGVWDFDDNDEDESDVDPFYTPAILNNTDTMTLLGKIFERSSTNSPEKS